MLRSRILLIAVAASLLGGCSRPAGPTPPSVTELSEMLQDPDPNAQITAAAWIKELGPRAVATLPGLLNAMKSPDQNVRMHAAIALGFLGPDAARDAVPALTTALRDPDRYVSRAAIDALGQYGPAAASAIPALEELNKTPDACASGPAVLAKIRNNP